ncbi:MAG: branched-chain amino acid aminotransferase [Bacteroidota bacterium]
MSNIDWKNLPFDYYKTDYNIRCYFSEGEWGELEVSSSEYLNIHMAATALHYGQEAFEGMKAYRGKHGDIRIFRWEENFKRMKRSARGILMEPVPKKIFRDAIFKAVKLNEQWLPPYGTGAALYIRPLLLGSGAEIGVKPAEEYLFVVFVTPVGPYFKEGFNPIKIAIVRDSDRTSPLGTGMYKVGGNYAASLPGINRAKSEGYTQPLYLDAKEKKYIDEIGAANFFGIKNNTYITPDSNSILPSITNKSIMEMAPDLGLKVERRPVPVEELDSFDEVGACGTAAIIAPIGEIRDLNEGHTYTYSKDGKPGPISTKLYKKLLAIQYGEEEDPYGWVESLE